MAERVASRRSSRILICSQSGALFSSHAVSAVKGQFMLFNRRCTFSNRHASSVFAYESLVVPTLAFIESIDGSIVLDEVIRRPPASVRRVRACGGVRPDVRFATSAKHPGHPSPGW